MTRTTDPNTLLQVLLRGQHGGTGQRVATQQFQGVYDATIYSVDAENETCMVIVGDYDATVPLGPSPYFGGPPTVGSACVVGFVTAAAASGGVGQIQVRVLADNGFGTGSGGLSPLLLMGA